jgi:hypothetical protein
VYVLPTSRLGNLALMAPRPNQAVDRGIYYSPHHTTTRSLFNTGLQGLGQSEVSMPLLLGGLAVGGLALWLLFGKRKRASTSKRISSLSATRERATEQLKELGA